MESFRLEICLVWGFLISHVKKAVSIYDFLVLLGEVRNAVKPKDRISERSHFLITEEKHTFRATSDFGLYQGFSLSKIHFSITETSTSQLNANLELCHQKAGPLQVRHLLSLKQDQNKGFQYQEQDFDNIQEWLSFKP